MQTAWTPEERLASRPVDNPHHHIGNTLGRQLGRATNLDKRRRRRVAHDPRDATWGSGREAFHD